MDNNESKLYKKVIWVCFANILGRLFTFVSSIVTARLLYPEDFGVIAMAATFSNFIDFISYMGVDAFIVSRRELSKEHINSIFLVYLAIAFGLSITMILISPIVSSIYKCPEVKNILFFAGFSFFTSTLSVIPRSLLVKNMKQDIVSKIEIFKNFVLSVLIIIFAISGFKYMSYVISFLITNILVSLSYLSVNTWKFKRNFDFSIIKDLYKYCKNFSARSFMMYFVLNSDYIIAGYLLGKNLLGYYYFSFEKSIIILQFILITSNSVYFPVFSKYQTQKDELKKIFNSFVEKQTLLIYPAFFILIILANEIFNVLFGNHWNNSILIFQILVTITFLRNIAMIIHALFDATDKPDQNFKHYLSVAPISIILYFVGAHYGGLVGLSLSAVLAYNIGYFMLFKRADNIYGFGFFNLVRYYLKPVIPLLLQLPIIIPLKLFFIYLNLGKIFIIFLISILSIILYLVFLKLFMKEEYNNVIIPLKYKILSKLNNIFGAKNLWKETNI